MHQNAPSNMVNQRDQITGMNRGSFPLTYIGCPSTHSKKKKKNYVELIDKIRGRLQTYKGRLLYYEGKEVLIKNMLQSVPLYVLSVVAPPKSVIK